VQRAFELLYGRPADVDRTGTLVMQIPMKYEPDRTGTAYVALAAIIPWDRADRWILMVATPSGDCHACPALVDAFVFAKQAGVWTLALEQRNVTRLGEWSGGVSASLVRLGPDRYGVLVRGGRSGMGWGLMTGNILAIVDNRFQLVLSAPLSEGCYGCIAGPQYDWEYTGSLRFSRGRQSEFDDIHLHLAGTRAVVGQNKQIVAVDETHVFVFNGREYVEAAP
jgi:hypothetical protein